MLAVGFKKLYWLGYGILFFSLPLIAYDFEACRQKAMLSMERVGNTYGIAIKRLGDSAQDSQNNLTPSKVALFVYSPKSTPKGYKILKHDPFIGMYLLESKTELLPISLRTINKEILEDEMASILPHDGVSGKIATRMQSPINYATLNTPTFQNSLISTVCDHIYGIGIGKNEFIEKAYLDRFILSDSVHYGDIGVRVFQNSDDRVEVNLIDPFFRANPFAYGDIIMMINGEAIPNVAHFNRVVFDLKEGEIVPVRISRKGVVMELQAYVDKRRGGMLLKEDFLGRVGIEVDSNFVITRVAPYAKNGFERLKVGDKVLRVNQQAVPQGYDAIIRLLGQYPDKMQKWLISRDDFQFFINVNQKESQKTQDSLIQGLLNESNAFSL
ncbi:PDZ domain-containing protein [Helicobacter sp. MIT 05-5294]|uniref:DUF7488 domain-containing protein n=1 Tax=Helicobacter sp. MIT 05-5294 TaxID=1548150 RepID=UPI000ADFE525|nr:PDZ domain-containing protein [Helicobacter sp. MIT 05-5294]TLD86507.1 PDZ domain-containing protein [Helicobacter sp. MIT 05-5294]